LGLNYADHAAEGGNKVPEYPHFSCAGPVRWWRMARRSSVRAFPANRFRGGTGGGDRQRARHLTAENALSAVAGYSCFNDGSIRDYQRKSSQWTIGKNFDATGAFGPWFVRRGFAAAWSCGPGHPVAASMGQVMQNSNTRNMLVSTVYALQLLSEAMNPGTGRLDRHGYAGGRRLCAQSAGCGWRRATSSKSTLKESACCPIRLPDEPA